jgi:phosphoribosyl 1,2-cyclic phosphodiesterase
MLGSGSTGNSLFLKGGETRILIDAGLSCLQIKKRLKIIGESLSDINAIIITHEHADHMRGIGVICRQFDTPVFLTPSTRNQANQYLLYHQTLHSFDGDVFTIGDLQIEAFPVPHDAADPVGFCISDGTVRVAVATDIGRLDPMVVKRLNGMHFIVLEANHDRDMLANGPYPRFLKNRIAGPDGHLANEDTAKTIMQAYTSALQGVMLAHLSRYNNTPDIALNTVSGLFKSGGLDTIPIFLSHPHRPSQRLKVTSEGISVLLDPDVGG